MGDILDINSIIKFGKYKNETIEKLIKDKKYANWIINNCALIEKKVLKSIKYYHNENIKKNKNFGGALTTRIKCVIDEGYYDDLLTKNILKNINTNFKTKKIISSKFNIYIKKIYEKHPSGAGCFIDYLFRKIVSNFLHVDFVDDRAELLYCELKNNDEIKINIYLNPQGVTDNDFPDSFIEAYEKMKNNKITNIKKIINEIFIVSLSHSVYFGQYDEEKTTEQYNFIKKNTFKYENEIINIIENFEGEKFSLNTTLIESDCDLIIDDNLIDFKVSKRSNDEYELLQLLGYSAMIKTKKHDINKIHIIDFYKNEIKSINISKWKKKHRYELLNYLNYNINKKEKKIDFIGIKNNDIKILNKCDTESLDNNKSLVEKVKK